MPSVGASGAIAGSDGRVLHSVSAGAGAGLVSADIFFSRSGLADAGLLVCDNFFSGTATAIAETSQTRAESLSGRTWEGSSRAWS